MVYEIEQITTDKASGHTYVLVHFWQSESSRARGDEPYLVNDFLMQLRPTGQRVVTDAQGRLKRKDGSFIDRSTIDPLNRPKREDLEIESFNLPVETEIAANIERFMARAEQEKFSGDHTHREGSAPMVVNGRVIPQGKLIVDLDDSADPHDILKHPGVSALKEQIAIRKSGREVVRK